MDPEIQPRNISDYYFGITQSEVPGVEPRDAGSSPDQILTGSIDSESATSAPLVANLRSGIAFRSGSGIEFARPPEMLLGQVVTMMLANRPERAREYEANDELLGLCHGWHENQEQTFRLGLIGDRLIELGYPQDEIRIVLLMKYPHLWQFDWWPTCLAQL